MSVVFAGAIAMAVFDAVWLAGKRMESGWEATCQAQQKRGTIQLRFMSGPPS